LKTRIIVLTLIAVMVAAGFATGDSSCCPSASAKKTSTTQKADLKTDMDKVSYSIGTIIGNQFKQQELDVQFDAFLKGIKDALAGNELALNKKEMDEVMKDFQTKMMEKMKKKQEEAAAKNTKEGEAFLAANAKKDGVVTLPSGLQYKVIKEGKGEKLKATDTFKALYKGSLIDGTVFDSSEKHGGKPLELAVGRVIPGWTEALQLMPIGSKWMLYIPGNLAYGPRGGGELIGPNATLIFEIELLGKGEAKK